MRTILTLGAVAWVVAVLVVVLLAATTILSHGAHDIETGELSDEVATNVASSLGAGGNTGFIASATGEVEDLGEVTVLVSTSWDWDTYGDDYPCALVNVTPQDFPQDSSVVLIGPDVEPPVGLDPFTTDATVTITAEKHKKGKPGPSDGGTIDGVIRGGSVCEIFVDPGVCTINEGMTSFEIVGGDGEFDDAFGYGVIHTVFNGCTGDYDVDEIFLRVITP